MQTKPVIYGYLRISKKEQRLDRQINGLRGACDQLCIEKAISATAKKRPEFERLMKRLKPGDTFVVWDLDRAFRSAIDAMLTAKDLLRRDIHFKILKLNIDTATPHGRFAFNIWAASCQYEREVIIERTREGLEAARRRGKRLGRPRKLDYRQVQQIRLLLRKEPNLTRRALARSLGVCPQTLSRTLSRAQ